MVRMEELRVGDLVLTYSPAEGAHYTQVGLLSHSYHRQFLGWLDRSSLALATFLRLRTGSGPGITLTPSHVIFRITSNKELETVYASEVEVGDTLVQWGEQGMEERQVVEVQELQEVGTWAPLTMEGTLLVDGVLASCYASFPHTLSDLLLAPIKALPRLMLDDETSQHNDGVRTLVDLMKRAGSVIGFKRKVGKEVEVDTMEVSLPRMAMMGSMKHTEM